MEKKKQITISDWIAQPVAVGFLFEKSYVADDVLTQVLLSHQFKKNYSETQCPHLGCVPHKSLTVSTVFPSLTITHRMCSKCHRAYVDEANITRFVNIQESLNSLTRALQSWIADADKEKLETTEFKRGQTPFDG